MTIDYMEMKRFGFIALLLFSAICLKAQSLTDCENVVRETVNAINSYSLEALHPYLTSDFECSGQKGDVASLVLKATVKHADKGFKFEKPQTNVVTVPMTLSKDNLIVAQAIINGAKHNLSSIAAALYFI